MIRIDTILSNANLDGVAEFIDYVPDLAIDIAEETLTQFRPQMMAELQYVPGPVQYPIEWTSEKQRRAFFATDGFGRGIGAPRTNKMINSFDVRLGVSAIGFELIVENSSDYFPFVIGKLRPRRLSERGWQQPFHINTGWPRVGRTIDKWERKYRKEFTKRFLKAWAGDI